MTETAARQKDIMVMIIGLQLSIIGAAIDELIFLLAVGPLFTFAVYTNELRRR
ncbi:hypothetical protein ACODNH_15040 [Haloarcula sp. NS06]|uniref:hypothetical protein n=1 Tax=unclassified Haloarcula TaxID=2624677 RepID=UPI0027B6556E|nr:hypothetical protein [Haloarcula sp. H-GB4]MDQ2071586.1 hypothetical protein [Haloarcula sp. H-GB4]